MAALSQIMTDGKLNAGWSAGSLGAEKCWFIKVPRGSSSDVRRELALTSLPGRLEVGFKLARLSFKIKMKQNRLKASKSRLQERQGLCLPRATNTQGNAQCFPNSVFYIQ
ncbi:hypothetical protein [Roseibium algae]|uniref:Uncharacterized protein n=1 Tax=Roseibium algae TaxID=3123038 RepID=A0ABU8TN03_9HYPH